jgi:type I restriction enzyme, S subunit
MSFPAYDDYKDSGIECLGEIPIGWTPKRLKHVSPFIAVGIVVNPSTYVTDDGLPFIYGGDIREGIIDCENSRRISPDSSDANAKTRLEAGDVLTVRVGAPGVTAVVPQECEGGNCASVMLVRKGKFDSRWLCYLMNTPVVRNQVEVVQYGAAQKQFNIEHAVNFWLPVPDEDEQKAISWFLDVETSKIDGLVSEQRRLIELLKEKRQAVISHAVTKGLNPNAPMKPSGIQWLGDVPQHWSVKPLKYLATFRSGGTPSKTVPAYWHGDVPWASSKDLKTETLADTIDHITQHALDSDAATLVPVGSVLVVVRGMILLHTFPVVQTLAPMAINQDLKALTPANCIHQSYLPWLLRGSTTATFSRIDEAAHGTKVIRMEAWTSIELPVPPIEEQVEIVEAVIKRRTQIDNLLAEAERAIELLQERRTALISAAVTGKIDVRGFCKTVAQSSKTCEYA